MLLQIILIHAEADVLQASDLGISGPDLVFATNSVIVIAASLQLLDSVTDSKYGTVTT